MSGAARLKDEPALLGEGLIAAAEPVDAADAVAIVAEFYGLTATARPLAGEKDANFHIVDKSGREFLLKLVHSADDPSTPDMHTQAMMRAAERDPGLPIQKVVPTENGASQFLIEGYGARARVVRLVTFAYGKLQGRMSKSPAQRRNIGTALARLQLALRDFDHPAADHATAWDVKNLPSLEGALDVIVDVERRHLLRRVLDRFASHVAPRLPLLPVQVVHNDLSGDNILVDPQDVDRVTALLDFGDMVRTAAAIDVAVGAAYQLETGADPLAGALDFLSGFVAAKPLAAAEVDMLFDLILARMLVRIAITEWRAARFPENREYVLRNTPTTWAQLESLMRIDPHAAMDRIRLACAHHPRRS